MCTLYNTHKSHLSENEFTMRSSRKGQSLSTRLIAQLIQEGKEMEKEEKRRQVAQREQDRINLKHVRTCLDVLGFISPTFFVFFSAV